MGEEGEWNKFIVANDFKIYRIYGAFRLICPHSLRAIAVVDLNERNDDASDKQTIRATEFTIMFISI